MSLFLCRRTDTFLRLAVASGLSAWRGGGKRKGGRDLALEPTQWERAPQKQTDSVVWPGILMNQRTSGEAMTDTPKWTPGPWVSNYRADVDQLCVTTKANEVVATCRNGKFSDACLIAAAPDLFEALEKLFEDSSELSGNYYDLEHALNKARAALSKARGETT